MADRPQPGGGRRAQKLRLTIERLLLRGLHYRLLFAALIVLSVALIGGLLMRVLVPEFDEMGESVWWAFLRLTDPGYLGDDQGIIGRSISTVVTVLGYLLFLGLLIAFLTQWMNEAINRMVSGIRPLSISNHVLVLGWTHRTPDIVLNLLRTRDRTERFLKRRNAKSLRVVVLATRVDAALIAELKAHLGSYWDDRRVLLRSGSPLQLDHLKRVCFDDAASIILPGEDFSDRSPGVADADTLKTLLSIDRHTADAEVKPLAVAALYNPNRASIAHGAYSGETEILSTDQILCQLMAQSVRQEGIWRVFSELTAIQMGNAIFLERLRESGRTFGEVRRERLRAVAIGIIRSGVDRPLLNPSADTELDSDDHVIYIARRFADCAERGEYPDVEFLPAPSTWLSFEPPQRVLVLGWNRRVPALLRELNSDTTHNRMEIDVVGLTPVADRSMGWADSELPLSEGVRQHEANFLDPVVLVELEPWRYDRVILVARERMGDEAHADAATIAAYLNLRSLLADREVKPALLVELLDEENRYLFEGDEDVLVTAKLISYMLSQIALRRELAAIFTELSRTGGPQIVLRSLRGVDFPGEVTFDQLGVVAESRENTALGLITREGELHLNPERNRNWRIRDGDQLVALTTEPE